MSNARQFCAAYLFWAAFPIPTNAGFCQGPLSRQKALLKNTN